MSNKQNDELREYLNELQEENDKKHYYPYSSLREMWEAIPRMVRVKDKINKGMKSGLNKGPNPYKTLQSNDPRYDMYPEKN